MPKISKPAGETTRQTSGPCPLYRHAPEVFFAFLRLGLTSFGGPVAHIGYFRNAFVARRGWINDIAFAELIALCHFLPGPASSQVGMAIGYRRAGALGALAAWVAFTTPSAGLMIMLGLGAQMLTGRWAAGLVHGLNLVAVSVVAYAVWSMARLLLGETIRTAIAAATLTVLVIWPSGLTQVLAITAAGAIGAMALTSADMPVPDMDGFQLSRRWGAVWLILLGVLLVALPIAGGWTGWPGLRLASGFYRTGALVFGGGHVVLPLLQSEIVRPGWVSPQRFLAGYGAAQALPGPLFSFAAYLGVLAKPGPGGWIGGLLALAAIFLPGALSLFGVLPFWSALSRMGRARAAVQGASAAVVGLLAAALYNPVLVGAVHSPLDLALAVAGLCALMVGRISPVWIVLAGAAVGLVLAAA